MIVHVIVIQNG